MREVAARFLTAVTWTLLLLLLASSAFAIEDAELPPPPKRAGVRITFLPPPMEGALSLGIYDKRGKLVRVLHREATEKDFTVGLNGLITAWDGKDDAGQVAPAGTYAARGFAVGPLEVEGIAMHGNDWITDDDSPRLFKIRALGIDAQDRLRVGGSTPDGKAWEWRCDEKGTLTLVREDVPPNDWRALDSRGREVTAQRGKVYVNGEDEPALQLPGLQYPVSACFGRGDSIWLVDTAEAPAQGFDVKEFSAAGEFKRRLAQESPEFPPREVVAARQSDTIYVLDESIPLQAQRLRALTLVETAAGSDPASPANSTWKVLFQKTIWRSDTFAAIADKLGRAKPFAPEEKIAVRVLPNELSKTAAKDLEVQLAIDAHGAFFRLADGLPLRRVSETPHLKWAVMGREGGKAVTIFQSDGAVVEEFKARKLANVMAFDAGDYDWSPAKEK